MILKKNDRERKKRHSTVPLVIVAYRSLIIIERKSICLILLQERYPIRYRTRVCIYVLDGLKSYTIFFRMI